MKNLLLWLLELIARWLEPDGTPRIEAQIDNANDMGDAPDEEPKK